MNAEWGNVVSRHAFLGNLGASLAHFIVAPAGAVTKRLVSAVSGLKPAGYRWNLGVNLIHSLKLCTGLS